MDDKPSVALCGMANTLEEPEDQRVRGGLVTTLTAGQRLIVNGATIEVMRRVRLLITGDDVDVTFPDGRRSRRAGS